MGIFLIGTGNSPNPRSLPNFCRSEGRGWFHSHLDGTLIGNKLSTEAGSCKLYQKMYQSIQICNHFWLGIHNRFITMDVSIGFRDFD